MIFLQNVPLSAKLDIISPKYTSIYPKTVFDFKANNSIFPEVRI